MKVIIASDHGGFDLKTTLVPFIRGMGHYVVDIGCFSVDSIDYPDIAFELAEKVGKGEFERGVLICGTGVGMSICANKVNGVRCALCSDQLTAELTRQHNDSNILALGARIIGADMARAIVRTYLSTEFDEEQRHAARLKKLSDFESRIQ